MSAFFRRLSRLSAGIPGNIRACIDELNKLPIESFADPNETVKEFKQRAKIYALILCSKGETIAKAEGEARRLVRFQMLYHWTIAPESQIPWSEEALSKVQLLLPELKDRCDEWRNRLNQAVGELAKRPLPDSLQGLDLEALNLTEETAASVRHVWGNLPEDDVAIAKDYALASEKLTRFTEDIGIVFCLLLSHDQNIKSDNDKQFNELSDHLATFNLQTIRNFIAWSLFVVLLALFIIVLPYDLFREITRPNNPNVEPVENVDRIRSSIRIAAQFALGGFVSYGGALLGGAFYRRISVANNRFSYQQASAFVPIGAYIGIFVSAWVAATLANYLLFMAYWLPTSETPELLLGDFMEFSSRQAPLYSLSNAIFATYFMLCLQRFNSSGDAAISEMRRSRLLLEVIGLAVTSAILMGSAQILINIDVGDELFAFYAPSSKVLETSLAFAVPFLALLVVVHLMRRASTAREETSA